MAQTLRKSVWAKLSGKLEHSAIGKERYGEQLSYVSDLKPLSAEKCRGPRFGRIYAGPVTNLVATQTKPHKAHQILLKKALSPIRSLKSIGEYDTTRTR